MQQIGLVEVIQKLLDVAESSQAGQLHLHRHHVATSPAPTPTAGRDVEFLELPDRLGE